MIEANLRLRFQPFFDWLGRCLLLCSVSANFITLISFVTGILAGIFVAFNFLFLALVFLWFSGLCDVLDGTVARLLKSSKKVGAYLDLFSDRVVEVAIILGFTFLRPEYYLAYILFLIAVLMHFSTFLIAGALFKNEGSKSMYYDKSLVERAEAFVTFSFMMLFPNYAHQILLFFTILVFASAISRFFRLLDYAKKLDESSL